MSPLWKWWRSVACVFLHQDDWIIQPYGRQTYCGHCRECGRTWMEASQPKTEERT